MLRGKDETFPRSFGLSAELRPLGLQRGYSPAQLDTIKRACADYEKFAAEGDLSHWSSEILKRGTDKESSTDAEDAKCEKMILSARRSSMLQQLKQLMHEATRRD